MTESVITEFSGNQRDTASRIYRYGPGGVRVLDSRERVARLYQFDPSSGIMTENDPARPNKILRRFVFDNFGMLEETFAFGHPPRTFRYEAGGRQIVMREGGDYGAVGKTYTFEGNGVAETAFGRNGEIERVYVFDQRAETITIRSGGWYGNVDRTLHCERIDVSVFREPEAFLQFLMFTEKSAQEAEAEIDEKVAEIRLGSAAQPGQSRFAYTGPRHTSDPAGRPEGMNASRPSRPDPRSADRPSTVRGRGSDSGIDFIPDADAGSPQAPGSNPAVRGRDSGIPFEDRWQNSRAGKQDVPVGRSARIPLEERFRSSRDEDRTLSPGRSVEIPLDERFRSSRDEDRTLSRGRSAEIPLDERFQGSRDEDRTLSRGRSAEIPLDERFGREDDRQTSGGKSSEISWEERKSGRRSR
ncbi:MAG TPA: hypothetical protein VEI81_01450 [Methanoregula sp.]|nr:hypothetical protein [Methanoregula sp.]